MKTKDFINDKKESTLVHYEQCGSLWTLPKWKEDHESDTKLIMCPICAKW